MLAINLDVDGVDNISGGSQRVQQTLLPPSRKRNSGSTSSGGSGPGGKARKFDQVENALEAMFAEEKGSEGYDDEVGGNDSSSGRGKTSTGPY